MAEDQRPSKRVCLQSPSPVQTSYYVKQGAAILINNDFAGDAEKHRVGNPEDVANLTKQLENLNFSVEFASDFTKQEVLDKTEKFAESAKVRAADCVMVVIMSHGTDGMFETAASSHNLQLRSYVGVNEIWSKLAKEHLSGKPKLFFVQTCRGNRGDIGQKLLVSTRNNDDASSESNITQADVKKASTKNIPTLPNEHDFFLAYSTVQDYRSYRYETGSVFISSLCKELESMARCSPNERIHLAKILTRVHRAVANQNINYDNTEVKQSASFVSYLKYNLYFVHNSQIESQ